MASLIHQLRARLFPVPVATAMHGGEDDAQPSYTPSPPPTPDPQPAPRRRRWPDKTTIYRTCAKWLVHLLYRPKYYGFDRIPKTGPAVLIANHVSYLDGLIIHAGIDRPVHYVIDKNIYEMPIVNYFMRLNGSIPIAPKREVVEAALDQISEYLRQGDLVCIFPEGRLTYTGSLGRFKPGIEFIIKRDPVPVYPIALNGLWGSVFSRKYLKARFRWWPRMWRKRDISAICGEPVQPEDVTINRLQEIVLKLKYSL